MGKLKGYKERTFYMRPALFRRLAAEAKRMRVARYELLDEALMMYFEHLNKKKD